jgi:hypothetical protein
MNQRLTTGTFLRFGFLTCVMAASAASVPGWAHAQMTASDPNEAAIRGLQTYELPDQTASVRLPPSWQVFATGVAFIQAKGPNGELAIFGAMVPAQDSSAAGSSSTALTQAYSADPAAKFLASLNWIRARDGKPPLQGRLLGETRIKNAPAAFGQCTNVIGILNGGTAAEADFCSLPEDAAGNYRNFFKAVGLPLREARQERSLMEAILASYRLNLHAIQGEHEAIGVAPPASASASSIMSAENAQTAPGLAMAEAQAINNETLRGELGSDDSVTNFTNGVLNGDTPVYMEGQSEPFAWIGN